jgi:hypothetical protein
VTIRDLGEVFGVHAGFGVTEVVEDHSIGGPTSMCGKPGGTVREAEFSVEVDDSIAAVVLRLRPEMAAGGGIDDCASA